MAFYTEIAKGSSMSNLQSNLNDALGKYSGVTQVVDCGAGYGSSKSRGGVMLQASSNQDPGSDEVKVWAAAEKNLGDLGGKLNDDITEMTTIVSLSLDYDKNNNKWRALVVYLTTGTSVDYSVLAYTDGSKENVKNEVDETVGASTSVAAFGYTYGNSNNGVLCIYVPS